MKNLHLYNVIFYKKRFINECAKKNLSKILEEHHKDRRSFCEMYKGVQFVK